MDKAPPEDFDPYLVDDPMQQPSKRDNEGNQRDGALNKSKKSSMLHIPLPIPEWVQLLVQPLLTKSCCGGVLVLYGFLAWDHGWFPQFESQFAMADDVKAMQQKYKVVDTLVVLQTGKEIRELTAISCTTPSDAIFGQIEKLRLEYKAITGADYPHLECKKA